MRKLLAIALASVVVAAPAYAATRTVKIGDNWFVRPGGGTVTVSKGTVVKWKNTGSNPHNVKVRKGPKRFKSDTLFPGDTFRKRMKAKGRYRIVCTIHTGQKMTLKVR